MKGWLLVGGGILLALLGGVWVFQGLGMITGSFMTGQKLWFGIGLVLVVAAVGLIVAGAKTLRNRG